MTLHHEIEELQKIIERREIGKKIWETFFCGSQELRELYEVYGHMLG